MSFVFTGVGLVSAVGSTPRELFAALLEDRPARVTEERLPGSGEASWFPARRIVEFDPRDYLSRKGLDRLSRTSQLACAAASRLAGTLAGLVPADVGVVFGSAWSSMETVVRFEREAHTEGPRFVDPLLFTEAVANVPAGQLSIFFGWSALNVTLAAGSASGLEAVGTAIRLLDEGRARAVVVGGGDELNPYLLHTLREEGAEDAPGGEGACLFAVESESSAAARGATMLARVHVADGRVLGSGLGGAVLLQELLAGSGVGPAEIDLLVLSAGSRSGGDRAEAAAVEEVFGDEPPFALRPRAILGETWAAAGPLGAAVALEAMRWVVPPWDHTVRHAVVFECPESGHGAALLLSAMGV